MEETEAAATDSKDADKENADIEGERKINYIDAFVTEVTDEAKVFVNHVDEGKKLEELMGELRSEFTTNPPLAGAHQPRKGTTNLPAKRLVEDWGK